MYYQEEPGIYVYYWKTVYYETFQTRKLFASYYKTVEDFFWGHSEHYINENVGYSVDDKICQAVIGTEYRRGYHGRRYVYGRTLCNKINCTKHDDSFSKAVVVADHNGKLFTRDRLVGLYREYWCNRSIRKNKYNRRNGCKKSAWGGWRSMKTFQERKWANAWDDEEFVPKVRAARNDANLPDAWDDYYADSAKSWKIQSKRKHQWKEK